MKTALFFLILANVAFAADPSSSPAASKAAIGHVALANLFNLVGPDYKKGREVPDTFFNPFKIEATTELTLQKRGATVSEQSVSEAVAHRGISGIVYTGSAGNDRVIIGDEVFRIGDELVFPDGDKGGSVPLVAGASVYLREVGNNSLVFDFAAEGETAHRSTVSLRSFWKP